MSLTIITFERIRDAAWEIAREHVESQTGHLPLTAKQVRKTAERIQDAIERELADDAS